MESWRKVWREGIAPLISTDGLEALRTALTNDDARLLQGATTTPPPLQCVQDWPVEAACVLGYCGWQGEGLESVAEVEEYFARLCYECDHRLGEPAACRWFICWFDETPRDEVRSQLLAEVRRTLANRRVGELSNGAVDVDVAPVLPEDSAGYGSHTGAVETHSMGYRDPEPPGNPREDTCCD